MRRLWPRLDLVQVLALAAILFPAAAVHPQSSDQNKPGVLRLSTKLVTLSVVVTDAQGHPIRDLSKDDFTLLDGGKPQQIDFFNPVDVSVPRSAAPLPPDTYTNRPQDYGALPSVTVLLFDALNSRWTSQGYSLHRMRTFLRHLQPQDRLGIYVLSDDLIVVHNVARDSSDILAAIHRYDERHSPGDKSKADSHPESSSDRILNDFISGKDTHYRFELSSDTTLPGSFPPALSGYATAKLEFAASMTVASVEAITRELSGVPGRKSLIWVTDGIGLLGSFEQDDLRDYILRWQGVPTRELSAAPPWLNGRDVERLIRQLNDGGVVVYTVDSRGLETMDLGFRTSAPSAAGLVSSSPAEDVTAATPKPNPDLLELSKRTGGRSFFNHNDLETGLQQALNDSQFSYSLAYYPTHNQWKGAWRKIQVRVNRPGAAVLSRAGYFALPDAAPGTPKDRIEFLTEVAASPIDSTALPLRVQLAARNTEGPTRLDARVHVDPAPLLVTQSNGHSTANTEILFMQIGDKGKLLNATQKSVDADLSPEEFSAAVQKGWDIPVELTLLPGADYLCVILHDYRTDEVGSVRIPLARYATSPAAR